MSVPFTRIPANIRVPLFYAEIDNSQASYFEQDSKVLLIGQKLAAGTAAADTPILVSRTDEAIAQFGRGSILARMHAVARAQDPMSEIWCIPLSDAAAGAAATGTVTVIGPASAAGTLTLYVAGQRVQIAVAATDSVAQVATALAAAINAATDLPVTAMAAAAVVTLTARHKGTLGNDITLIPNRRGALGGEAYPSGLSLTISAMTGGSGDPALIGAIAAMGDEAYAHIILPYTDSAALDAIRTEMGDISGRWSYARQLYGHVWSARRGSLGQQVTFGDSRNDPHVTVADIEPLVPQPVWEIAAAYGMQNAAALEVAPHRPTQTLALVGIDPAPAGSRRTMTERQSLLMHGIATTYVAGGVLRIERAVTTYRVNDWGVNDPSYLDVNTLVQLSYILQFLKGRVTQKYGRHALANNGKRIGPGVVTPNIVRGELTASYDELERSGIAENAEAFAANLIVERNATNPNRLDVLYPPDLVNQLRIFALLAQFRLQYT